MSRTKFRYIIGSRVATSDTLRESGIPQWLLIFSWNAMVSISLTSIKTVAKVDEAADALKQIAKSGKKVLFCCY